VLTSTPTNITFPLGGVTFSSQSSPLEICGWSDERQDWIIAPVSIAPFAEKFKGYFCARFDETTPQPTFGVIQNGTTTSAVGKGKTFEGPLLSAYAKFPASPTGERVVTLRVGTSFISEAQARKNIDAEIPDADAPATASPSASAPDHLHLAPGTLEHTAYTVRKAWADLLDRVQVQPFADGRAVNETSREYVDLQAFYTGMVHTLTVGLGLRRRNSEYAAHSDVCRLF
jgi:hypothetical protein